MKPTNARSLIQPVAKGEYFPFEIGQAVSRWLLTGGETASGRMLPSSCSPAAATW